MRMTGAFKARALAGSQLTQLYRGCTIYYIAVGLEYSLNGFNG